MTKHRPLLALAAVPLLLAFVIACSSGDDDDAPDSGSNTQPTAAAPAVVGGGAGNGATGGGDATGGGAATGGGDGASSVDGDGDAETILANCPELAEMYRAFATGGFAAPGSTADIDLATDVFQNAANNAPDEIQADMQVIANGLSNLQSILDELDLDLSNPASFATLGEADIQRLTEALDEPGMTEASTNVDNWITENCQ